MHFSEHICHCHAWLCKNCMEHRVRLMRAEQWDSWRVRTQPAPPRISQLPQPDGSFWSWSQLSVSSQVRALLFLLSLHLWSLEPCLINQGERNSLPHPLSLTPSSHLWQVREGNNHLYPAYLGTEDVSSWNQDWIVYLCNKYLSNAYFVLGVCCYWAFSNEQNT